ncbi:MAG: CPBP family intramembrane metalloprotease [Lactobacillaceae bacterium]|jgi:membrane protease YdiL (CAAX protease family)|nr:CPBP family intramembrane metalloprotease [Lactobacillaceae bacterium]
MLSKKDKQKNEKMPKYFGDYVNQAIDGVLMVALKLAGMTGLPLIIGGIAIEITTWFHGSMLAGLISVIFSAIIVYKVYHEMQNKYEIQIFEAATINNIMKAAIVTIPFIVYEQLLVSPIKSDAATNTLLYYLHGLNLWVAVLTLIIVVPFLEETFFRGIMFKYLERFGIVVQVVIPTLIFTFIHVPSGLLEFSSYLLMASVFMLVRVWTGTLGYSIVVNAGLTFLTLLPVIVQIL